jgi:hypothetical protein
MPADPLYRSHCTAIAPALANSREIDKMIDVGMVITTLFGVPVDPCEEK